VHAKKLKNFLVTIDIMTLVHHDENVEILYKGLTKLPSLSLYTYTIRKDGKEPSIPSEFLTAEIKKENIETGDGVGFCTVWDKYLNVYVWERKKILLHFGYMLKENNWERSSGNDIGCIYDLKVIDLERDMLEKSAYDYSNYQKLHWGYKT
jgi:hypothetical protein